MRLMKQCWHTQNPTKTSYRGKTMNQVAHSLLSKIRAGGQQAVLSKNRALWFINSVNSWLRPEWTGLALNFPESPSCEGNLSLHWLNFPAGGKAARRKHPQEYCLIAKNWKMYKWGDLLRRSKKEQMIGIHACRQHTKHMENNKH